MRKILSDNNSYEAVVVVDPSGNSAGEAVTVFSSQSGTATNTVQFMGAVTSFQITGTSTFSCDVFVSQDGVNFVEFDLSPAITSDIYMIDPYVNAYFKFTLTANAGLVTVVLS